MMCSIEILWKSIVSTVTCVAGFMVLSGCSAENNPRTFQGCIPNAKLPCQCADYRQGVMVCAENGLDWSDCQCESALTPAVSTDDAIGNAYAGVPGTEMTSSVEPIAGSAGSGSVAPISESNTGMAGAASPVTPEEKPEPEPEPEVEPEPEPEPEPVEVDPNTDQTGVPATEYCVPASDWDPSWSEWEEAVLVIVNQRRSEGADCGQYGSFSPAEPLVMNANLRCSARLHSVDMAENNYFDHTSLDGRTPFDRMAAAGYSGGTMGENIAMGQPTPESVMQGWMDSDGHCRNIMDSGFSEIGVGVFQGETGGNWWGIGSIYWTQNFGGSFGGGGWPWF